MAGVISARDNTIDGWFSNSVWVACTAEPRDLCLGHVDLAKDRWVGFAAAGTAFSAAEFVMKRKPKPVLRRSEPGTRRWPGCVSYRF